MTAAFRGLDIQIEPDHSLAETARIVSAVLGISLVETGRFDECPGFVAEHLDIQYVLLGVPEPDDDLRDVPSNEYLLQIWPLGKAEMPPDFASLIIQSLQSAALCAQLAE